MLVNAQVPGQRRKLQMTRIKIEKHAMLEQRQQGVANRAGEI
jgi:hypothetical protein